MLNLYLLSLSEAEKLPETLCERYFPERMKRARRFLKKEDYLRCVAAGALTAFVLGAEEREIARNEWGKPFLPGKKVFFSLSHSGDYALLAADDTEVGADLEKNAGFLPKVAERVFTPEELEWMNGSPEIRFYQLWTMKESVMKLDGRGFSLAPNSFSVLPLLKGDSILSGAGELCGHTETFRDCTLSVCALHPIGEPVPWEMTAEELLKLR